MSVDRIRFDFDTGTTSLVSVPVFGRVRQVRWAADAGDTGVNLSLTLLPDENDTGIGWEFLTQQAQSFVDTGVNVLAAGDRIRADVPAGVSGKLYVWARGG